MRSLALDKLGSALSKSGYELADQTPSTLTFRRTPAFAGPLGRLLFRSEATITMTFEPLDGDETRMVVAGEAPRRIARQFEQLAR